MYSRICTALQIQSSKHRKHYLDHADYTAPTSQHELDHTNHRSGVHLSGLNDLYHELPWDRWSVRCVKWLIVQDSAPYLFIASTIFIPMIPIIFPSGWSWCFKSSNWYIPTHHVEAVSSQGLHSPRARRTFNKSREKLNGNTTLAPLELQPTLWGKRCLE